MTEKKENHTPTPVPTPVQEKGFLQQARETISSTFDPVSDSLHESTKFIRVFSYIFVKSQEYYGVARDAYCDFTRSGPGYLSSNITISI